MVEVTEADRIAAWPTRPEAYADEVYRAAWLNGVYDKSRHIQSYATHREAAAKAERGRIVVWLRDDARLTEIEARRILGNLTTLTQADTDNWAKLILMKHGIADTLEKQP